MPAPDGYMPYIPQYDPSGEEITPRAGGNWRDFVKTDAGQDYIPQAWDQSNFKGGLEDWLPLLMLGGPILGMAGGLGAGLGEGMAGGAMDMGVGTQGWMDYLGSQAAGGAAGGMGGLEQVIQQLQQMPGGAQLAQGLIQQIAGGGGGTGMGTTQGSGGINLGSLLPLLGIGSGLKTMFGSNQAVDPAMINALWRAGQNTYQTAQDPQQALHDRTQQQVVDASRAGQSARGIAMGPYGAGVEGKNVSDFNIDWNNQQLQRQIAGTGAFAGAGNTAANAGVANNAQAFMQNQTGLNNLTTGLGGLFGTGGGAPGAGGAANPIGNWINSLFKGGSTNPGMATDYAGPGFNPNSSYDSSGQFTPYYTGTGAGTGPAYG